ncbi:hypothetical protein [Methanoculleus sp. 10]|uniref:hypothetical protein n=1 Tax=Methanoculleus sp. 10 TaxID=430615 RepID=UPI0025DA1548|nr:hypothetical protein [Methanoculleus sp. 10]
MKQIFSLAIALLIALAPLSVAAEPIAIDTTGASPPAPEVTCFEPSESQSTNVTPTFCVNESSTSGPLLSDIMVGCDGSGEYFSESGGSVTVTGTPEPWSVNTSESDYDSSLWNQSLTDTCEEHVYLGQPELDADTVPDGTTTDVTLHASVQPSRVRNITVESEHPYANNYTYTWEISEPGANQMRLHFDKLGLTHYDTLTIYDDLGRALVYYKGPADYTDFWTAWQTTDTLRVELVTDSQYTSYGFFIDKVECRDEKFPPTEHLAESYHPYANNYAHTWEISKPGANQIRLHFDKLGLTHYDTLTIYDDLGRALVYYKGPADDTDFWTEWQTADTLRVTLATDNGGTSYGFLIDKVECRNETSPPTDTEHRAESYHPYANNYAHTWNISERGANQIRLHFDKLSLRSHDSLTVYDELGRQLVRYGAGYNSYDDTDFWTEWQTADTLRVTLATDNGGTSYGFLIDRAERRDEKFPPTEHFAESYHPYANNYAHTWEISMPGANKTRLHFDKLSLRSHDSLTVYDKLGRQLVRYGGGYNSYDNTDFWTEWQTTDTLRVTLVTDNGGTSYGFLIDLIETEEGVFTPSQIPAPADLTLHSGWNFISVPRPLAAGNDTALIFTPVETGGRSIFRYDTAAGDWTALDEEDQIAPLEGLWIYSTGPTTVPLNVSTDPLIPPAERVLATGWNAIGITGTTPATARDALFSVSGKWTTLIGFDARRQVFETGIVSGGSKDYVDSRLVYQGKGYWLHMTGPGTLCAVGA